MARSLEREKDEAYKVYVTDSLALFSTMITRNEANIPRYIDMVRPHRSESATESPEEIISRFDKLRRT